MRYYEDDKIISKKQVMEIMEIIEIIDFRDISE